MKITAEAAADAKKFEKLDADNRVAFDASDVVFEVVICFYAFLAMLAVFTFAFAMFFGPIMIALELCTMGQMFGAMAVSAVVGLFVLWRMEND